MYTQTHVETIDHMLQRWGQKNNGENKIASFLYTWS